MAPKSTPTTHKRKPSPSAGSSEKRLRGDARIDAPHVLVGDDEPAGRREPDAKAAGAAESRDAVAVMGQLRVQAAQLAEHLRTRQADLDRREAQLNGLAAQLESDHRAARLWVTETQAELTERAGSLAQREQEVQQCLVRLASVETAHQRREQELETQAAQLREAADAIDEARRSLADKCETSDDSPPREQLETELAAARSELSEVRSVQAAGKRQLAEAEAHWAELQHQTEQLYRALQKDRKEFNQQRRRHEERMAAQERRAQQELDCKRRELARRSEQVDRCHAALQQLRQEVGQMHRSTLEIRMAAEELWSQLAGAAPPAALTRSLGEIRRQLAESYRGAGAALAEQKQELLALRLELGRQHERLANEKQRLEQWLARQEQEVQGRAARLVAREQQLDAQEAELRQRAEQWEMDRLAYQQEIHRLRGELQTSPVCG